MTTIEKLRNQAQDLRCQHNFVTYALTNEHAASELEALRKELEAMTEQRDVALGLANGEDIPDETVQSVLCSGAVSERWYKQRTLQKLEVLQKENAELKAEHKSTLEFYKKSLGRVADLFGISQIMMIAASDANHPEETYSDILIRLIKDELTSLRNHPAETQDVLDWTQAVLTALNVGDIKSGSPLHLKLREVIITYRASLIPPDIAKQALAAQPEGKE